MSGQGSTVDPQLRRVLRDDLRRGGYAAQIRRENAEMKQFYLSDEQRLRIRSMGTVRRFFAVTFWLLRSLLLHMSSFRRLMLILALLVIYSPRCEWHGTSFQASSDISLAGVLLLLFIIMLEVKDKMLARSELQAGRIVQKALIPNQPPAIPGWSIWLYYHPANEVGGDLLDYLPINSHRHGFALGDISDKGLGAALLMAKLQATLRALAPECSDPADLGQKMNRIYIRDTMANRFASMIYFEIASNESNIRFINAGHQPPLLVQGDQVSEWPKGGPALGIQPNASYTTQSLTLKPGETLFFYSDGLVEARNLEGHFWGEERLRACLAAMTHGSADAIGEKLVNRLQAFVGDAPTHDDITMIILQKL
ncbi:MAG TPA: PP2C family protein-serine/threonine phosphatase [bacterium]|nr:PP2C family protein-serine/threonine phosphatase [bacterium]HOY44598.1 PP2C family protein-serine/threonine phosphatase [bacterium]HPG82322.1 PP2C family protein-serine/threonine phosphatase [bacterium]HPM58329.1 PP2C family protein-serine/threonine phosphatase [bacterium]